MYNLAFEKGEMFDLMSYPVIAFIEKKGKTYTKYAFLLLVSFNFNLNKT